MNWTEPRTTWAAGDGVKASDLNRIEGNIDYLNIVTLTGQGSGDNETVSVGHRIAALDAGKSVYLRRFWAIGKIYDLGMPSNPRNVSIVGDFTRIGNYSHSIATVDISGHFTGEPGATQFGVFNNSIESSPLLLFKNTEQSIVMGSVYVNFYAPNGGGELRITAELIVNA